MTQQNWEIQSVYMVGHFETAVSIVCQATKEFGMIVSWQCHIYAKQDFMYILLSNPLSREKTKKLNFAVYCLKWWKLRNSLVQWWK